MYRTLKFTDATTGRQFETPMADCRGFFDAQEFPGVAAGLVGAVVLTENKKHLPVRESCEELKEQIRRLIGEEEVNDEKAISV